MKFSAIAMTLAAVNAYKKCENLNILKVKPDLAHEIDVSTPIDWKMAYKLFFINHDVEGCPVLNCQLIDEGVYSPKDNYAMSSDNFFHQVTRGIVNYESEVIQGGRYSEVQYNGTVGECLAKCSKIKGCQSAIYKSPKAFEWEPYSDDKNCYFRTATTLTTHGSVRPYERFANWDIIPSVKKGADSATLMCSTGKETKFIPNMKLVTKTKAQLEKEKKLIALEEQLKEYELTESKPQPKPEQPKPQEPKPEEPAITSDADKAKELKDKAKELKRLEDELAGLT